MREAGREREREGRRVIYVAKVRKNERKKNKIIEAGREGGSEGRRVRNETDCGRERHGVEMKLTEGRKKIQRESELNRPSRARK